MHVEQSPSSQTAPTGLPGTTARLPGTHFHSIGGAAAFLGAPAAPTCPTCPCGEQSWSFGRCDWHRKTLPRMLRARLGSLRSQLSSWAVKAALWHRCWGTEGTLHRLRVRAWRDPEEEQLSLSAPKPLPQVLSLSAGPANVPGKPPCPGYVSY